MVGLSLTFDQSEILQNCNKIPAIFFINIFPFSKWLYQRISYADLADAIKLSLRLLVLLQLLLLTEETQIWIEIVWLA